MKKPMIAVSPLYDKERESYWMLPGYMQGIVQSGGIPVMLPLTTDADMIRTLAGQFDGFLLTGGQDVSPCLYGEEKTPRCGEICPARDEMEQLLLQSVLSLNKPVLGICRGIQLLNASLGGTLYQDLPTETDSDLEHHQTPPYEKPIHRVRIKENTPLHTLLKCENLAVNSYHHQAIKELSPRLTAMAVAEDGLVEAVYMPGKRFVWAVQWHPEFSYQTDENSEKILQAFVAAAREREN